MKLLTRSEFREAVFKRDNYKCVFCGKGPVHGVKIDAHHIMDRKLFDDGGYYLDNGATLCDLPAFGHHYAAELSLLSVEDIRTAAKIKTICLPTGFDPTVKYDKWATNFRLI